MHFPKFVAIPFGITIDIATTAFGHFDSFVPQRTCRSVYDYTLTSGCIYHTINYDNIRTFLDNDHCVAREFNPSVLRWDYYKSIQMQVFMDMQKFFVVCDGIVVRDIAGVRVLVPAKSIAGLGYDQFILTNLTGQRILSAFEHPTRISDVIDHLCNEYPVEKELVKNDVIGLVNSYHKLGILVEVTDYGMR